ncbi:MAG: tripartite tricarboxylate transporter permease [Alphaproteobacteria bacterium]|nr:tripartite tricarboxylate transporter permease [Alphaproteobacteria bacterium]
MYDISIVLEGLSGILQPKPFLLMVMGMAISSVFAAVPGVGSLLFLSMMVPYAMTLTPYECIALVLGIATVSNTANTFSSVLIAVPGSSGSQATIVDGYPMARNGEARRAFGAAYTASAIGAIFGAMVFVLCLPVVRPLVLAVGSPELMMLVLWGLCAVALLGGNAPLKGLLAAVIGLAIALIGADERSAIERFTFDSLYLVQGVPLIIVALGIFAVPELIGLAGRGTSVSTTGTLGSGTLQGVKDVFKNFWLVIRCSTIGVWVGAMPGLGSSVADWFAYAHTVQSSRDKKMFGKGDVRGVIGPESSNNAKEGGALIPTTLFGIPGSTSFAIILYVFIAVGIQPGQSMLTTQLPYLYAMVGVLVIANLMATALAIGFSGTFAKLSLLEPRLIFPMIVVLCFIGAFSVSYSPDDLIALVVFSTIGTVMKRYDWPRPPLLLAVVLGPQFETYLWLSADRYDFDWITRPGVLIVLALIAVTIFLPMVWRNFKRLQTRNRNAATPKVERPAPGDTITLLAVIGVLAFGCWIASEWPERASFAVFTIAGAGIFLAAVQIGLNLYHLWTATPDAAVPSDAAVQRREVEAVGWILGFFAACFLIGFHAAFLLFPILYIRLKGGSWVLALFCGGLSLGMLLAVFEGLIKVVWPAPLIYTWFAGEP